MYFFVTGLIALLLPDQPTTKFFQRDGKTDLGYSAFGMITVPDNVL